jgi:hypothetical protein
LVGLFQHGGNPGIGTDLGYGFEIGPGFGMFLEYPLKHIAGILQTLIAEFQSLILGAGPYLASGTPATGGFGLTTQAFQLLRRDLLAGFFEASGCQLRKSLLIAGGIGYIYIALSTKATASAL